MTDASSSEQELMALATLGRTAEELRAEPFIARWFDDTEQAMVAMLREGHPDDAPHWHRMLDCLDKLRGTLDHYMRTGALAANELKGRQTILKQVSRFKFNRGA